MTLEEKMLEQLNEWQFPDHAQRLEFRHNQSGWGVILESEHLDDVACKVTELRLFRTAEPKNKRDTLSKWAERAAKNATGLLESLRVWEVDVERNDGFLRSDSPTVRDDKRQYYEVHLDGLSMATVRRYQTEGNGRPKQISFTLTNEGLAKLAADLTAD